MCEPSPVQLGLWGIPGRVGPLIMRDAESWAFRQGESHAWKRHRYDCRCKAWQDDLRANERLRFAFWCGFRNEMPVDCPETGWGCG